MWIQPAQISACAYDERTLRSSLKSISQHYSGIKMPVAIVTGSDDRILEPAKHAYPLQKAIKHSKLVVLPDTGHNDIEQNRDYYRFINEFLADQTLPTH